MSKDCSASYIYNNTKLMYQVALKSQPVVIVSAICGAGISIIMYIPIFTYKFVCVACLSQLVFAQQFALVMYSLLGHFACAAVGMPIGRHRKRGSMD